MFWIDLTNDSKSCFGDTSSMKLKLNSLVLIVGTSVGFSTLSFANGKNWQERGNRIEARKENRQEVRDFRKEQNAERKEMRGEHREAMDAQQKVMHEKRAAFHTEMAAAKTPEERQAVRQKHEAEMSAQRKAGEVMRDEIKAEKKEYWEGRKMERQEIRDNNKPAEAMSPPVSGNQ